MDFCSVPGNLQILIVEGWGGGSSGEPFRHQQRLGYKSPRVDLHFDSGPDTACLANCCFGDFCSRWPPSSNTGRVFTTRIGVTGRHRRFIHSPRTKRRPHREVSDVKLKQCRPARWWKALSDFSTGCCLPSAPVCWSSGFTGSVCRDFFGLLPDESKNVEQQSARLRSLQTVPQLRPLRASNCMRCTHD